MSITSTVEICIQHLGQVEEMVFAARCSYASAVLRVVILSVCYTRALWLIQRTYRRYFYTTWKGNHCSQMWFFVQLCSSWHDFNWLEGSRGLSAAAELLVLVGETYSETYAWCMCPGGAVLGPRTTVTVTIARTGYANGKFGFQGSLTLSVARSTTATTLPLMLERAEGSQGNQIVSVDQSSNNLRHLLLNYFCEYIVWYGSSCNLCVRLV